MQKKLTVSQLNKYIKGVFEDELILHNLSVEGEAVEIKTVGSATYIMLKDEDSAINCVCFNGVVGVAAGARVVLHGRVEFYAKSGKVSFIAKSVVLSGEGLLLAKQRELREKLEKEGIFSNKRVLPKFVRRVALITSGEGAVLHDFMSVVNRLDKFIEVEIFSVKVQGSGAGKHISDTLSHITPLFDVIVIARGGGSVLDLSEFNNEGLARNIHASKVVVISAIGHETDYTLSDFAADIRAGTPSMAAEIIATNNSATLNQFINLSLDNAQKIANIIGNKYRSLTKQTKISSDYVQSIVHSFKKKLLYRQISYQLESSLNKKESLFKVLVAKVEAANPLKLLTEGYSKITKDGKNITSAKQLKAGDNVDVFVSDGKLSAKIEKIIKK